MERNKQAQPDENAGKIWFKRAENTNGVFEYQNHYIKPGQRFMAFPDEIPESVRDVIVPQEDVPEKPVIDARAPVFTVKPAEADGLFNVVDSRGKVLNDLPLTEVEAQQMIKALQ